MPWGRAPRRLTELDAVGAGDGARWDLRSIAQLKGQRGAMDERQPAAYFVASLAFGPFGTEAGGLGGARGIHTAVTCRRLALRRGLWRLLAGPRRRGACVARGGAGCGGAEEGQS